MLKAVRLYKGKMLLTVFHQPQKKVWIEVASLEEARTSATAFISQQEELNTILG